MLLRSTEKYVFLQFPDFDISETPNQRSVRFKVCSNACPLYVAICAQNIIQIFRSQENPLMETGPLVEKRNFTATCNSRRFILVDVLY